jgi:tetratricopeptide (TPR) repeat protein
MQASVNKYIIFLIVGGALGLFQGPVFAQSRQLNLADSLFTIGRYSEAKIIYQKSFENTPEFNPNLLTKLAYLSEKSKEPAQTLYYLSLLAQKKPSVRLLQKISNIASEYRLEGYEFNDFSYFLVFYKKYGGYIPILLLTLGIYVVMVMLIKIKNEEPIQKRHKWATVFYLLALLGLINLSNNYSTGVIRNDVVFLRSFPSAASPVYLTLSKGHKLMVIGNRDHWQRVIWEGEIVYIRKDDLWII